MIESSKAYFSVKALSNSTLGLLTTPRLFKLKLDNPDIEGDEKVHFRIGSALDCLLTTPDRWQDLFTVVDVSRPTGLMGKFVDNLPDNLDPVFYETAEFEEAYKSSGYKTKLENVIKKFWENPEFFKYYLLTRDKSKTILSKEEAEKVYKAKELIEANKFTRYYFTSVEDSDGMIERFFQAPIYFKYLGCDCKALLDGVLINHKTKTITPFDLKTTGKSVHDFEGNFISYGYYRQAAMYYTAVMSEESPFKTLIDDGYVVEGFKFIVAETKVDSFNPALIFNVSLDTLEKGLKGFSTQSGRRYKGINELIENYKVHTQTGQWDLPIDVWLNNGEVELNIRSYAEEQIIPIPDI